MKCPFCGCEDSKVTDTRHLQKGDTRRRRECENCGKKFTTYERVVKAPIMVVKKDGTREEYDKDKIRAGIARSCHKRPVSAEEIDKIVDDIENKILDTEKREVSAEFIGEALMDKLKEVDEVAYIRFASVYREFKDVDTFMEEINKVFDRRSN